MSETPKNNYCLNCSTPFSVAKGEKEDIYCHVCGQSSKDSKLSIFRLVGDALSNIFNLDSRLVHTFRDIFSPSKLTQAYISGRRKYYVNPAGLFIFLLIVLIPISLYAINLSNSDLGVTSLYENAERSVMLDNYNHVIDSLATEGDSILVNGVRNELFDKVVSVKKDTIGKNGPVLAYGKNIGEYGISSYDAVHLSLDDLYSKYNITGFWNRINVSQYIRLRTDPAGAMTFGLKNVTWAVFISVLLISIFMKLIYIRGRYFLVEHAVLTLNIHSFMFFSGIIYLMTYLIFRNYVDGDDYETLIDTTLILFIVGVQFFALKKYYQQGIFKTLLKQLIINVAYLIIFCMVTLFVGLISVFLY